MLVGQSCTLDCCLCLRRGFCFRSAGLTLGLCLRRLCGTRSFLLGALRLFLGLVALALDEFLGLLRSLFDSQNLEALDRIGDVANFILALEPGQRHIELTGCEPLHGFLDRQQWPGDPPRNHHKDFDGENRRKQRATQAASTAAAELRRGARLRSPWRLRAPFGDIKNRRQLRHRRPVVGFHIHCLARDQRRQRLQAQGGIVAPHIFLVGLGDRRGEFLWQRQPARHLLQEAPRYV